MTGKIGFENVCRSLISTQDWTMMESEHFYLCTQKQKTPILPFRWKKNDNQENSVSGYTAVKAKKKHRSSRPKIHI